MIKLGGGWKVDPDGRQDRKNGECSPPRKMTPEEMKKYGVNPENINGRNVDMKKAIIMERMIEIIKEHGLNKKAQELAAKEFGVSVGSIASYISLHKLKNLIMQDKGIEKKEQSVPVPETSITPKPNIDVDTNTSTDTDVLGKVELEMINQIKSIIRDNKNLEVKNKMLQSSLLKVKSALEEILASIA